MKTGLEAYKAVATLEMSAMSDDKMTVEKAEKLRQIIENKLKDKETNDKVLKIIIDKDVTIGAIKALTFKEYNMYAKQVGTKMLTREEYNSIRGLVVCH